MSYGTRRLDEFLDELGAATPAPASGTAAALTAAMAAGLAELAAGVSRDGEAVARARALRTRLTALADEDAEAYTAFMRARSDETRARTIAVPQEIASRAAEVASLGQQLAEQGKPSVRGDALSAVELARGAERAAARLVAINEDS